MDLLIRLLIGGVVVSLFAIMGDVIKPKSLAGITAAAPAVALATLILTIHEKGVAYTALECRSMLAGAIAYLVFAVIVSRVQMKARPRALVAAAALMPVWGVVAAALWAVWLRK